MTQFNSIGGLRLKRSGRVSKEMLLKEVGIALDSLTEDFELESFSGANVYLQMYSKDGDRLALISSNGHVAQGIDINGLQDDFSFKKIGCNVQTVKEIEKAINRREEARRAEQEKIEAAYRAKHLARQEKEKAEKEELNKFKTMICKEFGVEGINEVASSVGRITTIKGMSKYIKKSQIPDCGHVYRASLKDPDTGKISEIRIYDENFDLISTRS